ncbi:MAG TPA: hypothetical protein VKC62_11995 [Gaiellaceae bacterium]|nr:hypothetical protein [Gaiellaceae bacterium]
MVPVPGRTASGSQPSGTYDSFEQALAARGRKREERPPNNGEPSAADIRSWTVERYAQEAWWPSVLHAV